MANQQAYYSQTGPDGIFALDLVTNSITTINDTGFSATPGTLAVTPDGSQIYFTARPVANSVGVCQTSTGNITTIPLSTGQSGLWVVMDPAGQYAYYVDNTNNNVYQISTATNLRTATVSLGTSNGTGPRRIAVSPDGTFLVVSSYTTPAAGNNQYATVISTSSLTVTAQIAMPNTQTNTTQNPCCIVNDTTGYVLYYNASTLTTLVELDFLTSTSSTVLNFTGFTGYGSGFMVVDGNTMYASMSNLAAWILSTINLTTFTFSHTTQASVSVSLQGQLDGAAANLVLANSTSSDIPIYNLSGTSFTTVATGGNPPASLVLGPAPASEQIVMIV